MSSIPPDPSLDPATRTTKSQPSPDSNAPTHTGAPDSAPFTLTRFVLDVGTRSPWVRNAGGEGDTRSPLDSLADYEFVRELGRGGMGIVYEARIRGGDQSVAVKMVQHDGNLAMADVIRFLAEADAQAHINHPNVVRVLKVGESRGMPYMVLEYLPGGNLASRLKADSEKRKHTDLRDAAVLVEKLARGVHAAHTKGIFHRDLKPSNVLFDAAGEPKVADFGLAKRDISDLTRSGSLLGTPAYMAPEQAQGRSERVAAPTDVWALGVILYELITDRRPFRVSSDLPSNEQILALLNQVVHDSPAAPRLLNPEVPNDLEKVCLKCLEKEPADRYPTAEGLAVDLAAFAAGRPVGVKSVNWVDRGARWVRKRPWVAALGAALVASLAVGTVVSIYLASQARSETNRANNEATLASQRADAEEKARKAAERELYFSRLNASVADWELGNVSDARHELHECPIAYRAWDWQLLNRMFQSLPVVLPANLDGGNSEIAITADGRLAAFMRREGGLTVWDLNERRPVATSSPSSKNEDSRGFLRFTADGKHVVRLSVADQNSTTGSVTWVLSGSDSSTAQETWRWTLRCHLASWVILDRFGRSVAVLEQQSGDRTGMLTVSDARTGTPRFTARAHQANCTHMQFSPGGEYLATIAEDRVVKVWKTATGDLLQSVEGIGPPPHVVAVSGSADRIAVSTAENLRVLMVSDSKELFRIPGLRNVEHLEFARNGRLIVLGGSEPRSLSVLDGFTGYQIGRLRGDWRALGTFKLFGDNAERESFLVHGSSNEAAVWDGVSGEGTRRIESREAFHVIRFSPDGTRCASSSDYHTNGYTVSIHDTATGARTHYFTGGATGTNSLAFSPDGSRLAAGSTGGFVRIWDLKTHKEVVSFRIPLKEHNSIYRLQFRDDGRTLLTVNKDGRIQLWETETGQPIRTLYDGQEVCHVGLHPDGKRAVISIRGGSLRWIDLETGQVVHEIERPGRINGTITFSPDGQTYLVAETDTPQMDEPPLGFRFQFELRDTETNRILQTWSDLNGPPLAEFTPDGKRVVAIGRYDHRLQIFDIETGRRTCTLPGHYPIFGAMSISPSGRWFAVGSRHFNGVNELFLFDALPEP